MLTAFPLLRCLLECPSMLRYTTCIACLGLQLLSLLYYMPLALTASSGYPLVCVFPAGTNSEGSSNFNKKFTTKYIVNLNRGPPFVFTAH